MSEFNKGYYRRQGRVQGAVEEQARIIKLLEENLISAKLGVIPVGNSNWWQKGMEYAIELIKGETNRPRAIHLTELKDLPPNATPIKATTENSPTWYEEEAK